jgi:purine-binding chemotaxis protein CheW
MFAVGDCRLAFPLAQVVRVVRAVEVAVLPHAPAVVRGVVDVAGQVVPVLSAHTRLDLPERPIGIDSHFALIQTTRRIIALVVDDCDGVRRFQPEEIVACEQVALRTGNFDGVVMLEDGLMLVTDAERFLLPQEERALEEALANT